LSAGVDYLTAEALYRPDSRAHAEICSSGWQVKAMESTNTQQAWRAAMSVMTFSTIVAVLASATLLGVSWQILVLKGFLIFILGLLPGWLYLQFMGFKAWTLYDEYVLNLHRLHIDDLRNLPKPPPGTPSYPEWHRVQPAGVRLDQNVYLKKFEAAYGVSAIPPSRRRDNDRDDDNGRSRRLTAQIKRERFGPVLLATALFTVGWAAVLQPEPYHGEFLHLFGDFHLSGLPRLPLDALRLGFIGSYAFVVQSLVRRYFQQDLKSRAYVGFVARIIFVSALIVALHPVFASLKQDASAELAVAFLLGFYPELGLRLLKHRVMSTFKRLGNDDEEHYRLGDLDGCNLWCQARLLEEGIEDMQNLVTANLVDLMVNTRMPLYRMLDWMDQAYLYLQLDDSKEKDQPGPRDRRVLRAYGVRTASQLCDLFETKGRPEFVAGISRLLNVGGDGKDDGRPSRIEAMHRVLDGEVNLWHIRAWKRRDWLAAAGRPQTVDLTRQDAAHVDAAAPGQRSAGHDNGLARPAGRQASTRQASTEQN
jgi:hypothetical protein